MGESLEVQFARMDEQMKMILSELREGKTDRKEQYERIEKIATVMNTINGRVENVENKLAGQAPTIEEFITIKHKVVGAGIMGKWLWAAGAGIIAFAYASREQIVQFLSK